MKTSARTPAILLCLAASLAVTTGCANREVRGAWYYVGDGEKAGMYLALNNTSGKTMSVTSVEVRDDRELDAQGWRWVGPKSLPSGGLLVLPLNDDPVEAVPSGGSKPTCLIPVRAIVTMADGSRERTVLIRFNGPLPAALPDDWLNCPRS